MLLPIQSGESFWRLKTDILIGDSGDDRSAPNRRTITIDGYDANIDGGVMKDGAVELEWAVFRLMLLCSAYKIVCVQGVEKEHLNAVE